MQQIKRKNPRLPVVMVDSETDLRRRHDLLRAGADLYVTKPTPARLQPGLAEEELALFADELVLFAERSFEQWEQLTGGGVEAGKKFYEMALEGDHRPLVRPAAAADQRAFESERHRPGLGDDPAARRPSTSIAARSSWPRDDAFVGLGGFGVTRRRRGDGRARALAARRARTAVDPRRTS